MSESPCQTVITDFSDSMLDKIIHFKVIQLTDSFFIWVGAEPFLRNIAVAMPTDFTSMPTSTTVLGSKTDLGPSSLAQKLSKRFSKQVFVSCSVPFDQQLSLLIEKRLIQELKQLL